MSNPVSVVES